MTRGSASRKARDGGEPALLLAFDVSTPLASVAVGRGREVLARAFLTDAREQASRLVAVISEALADAGASASTLEGVVVGRGPGSFTGVRIAAATARGLAMGLGIPVWPLSSLAAGAMSTWFPPPGPLASLAEASPAPDVGASIASLSGATDRPLHILFDAGGDRVYAAAYRLSEGVPQVLLEPSAATLPELLRGVPRDALCAGDGALRHARTLEAAGFTVLSFPSGVPTAEALLALHASRPGEEPETATSRWEPQYLRGSSARPPRAMGHGIH